MCVVNFHFLDALWSKRSVPCICVCVLSHFSCVRLLVTLWTVACQAPLSRGFFQARIPEWMAVPLSRGSSRPRDQTHISYVSPALAGRFFTTSAPWEACTPYDLLNKWADEWVHFHVTSSNCDNMFLWEPPKLTTPASSVKLLSNTTYKQYTVHCRSFANHCQVFTEVRLYIDNWLRP